MFPDVGTSWDGTTLTVKKMFVVGDELVGGGGPPDGTKLPHTALAICGDSLVFKLTSVGPKN